MIINNDKIHIGNEQMCLEFLRKLRYNSDSFGTQFNVH